jgi:sugar phosphate permease
MLLSLLLLLMAPRWDHWYLAVVALAAAAAFVAVELRTPDPFIDLRVLGGNPALLATYGRNLLAYVVSYAFIYGVTQWLEQSRGLDPTQAGLLLLPTFVTGIVVTSLTGRRAEIRGKLMVGGLAQLLACALLLSADPTTPIWLLITVTLVLGVPQGLISLANQNAVYHQADPARMGSSAGLLRTFMYLGAMIAAAANGAFLKDGANTAGLHGLVLFMLGCAVLLLVATVADRSLRRVGAKPATP